MKSDRIRGVNPGLLLGHVRDGRSIQLFSNEDMAAEFIAIVKMYDPQDDLIYVIYPHPTLAQKFIVAIFSPPGHFKEPETVRPIAIEKIRQRKAARIPLSYLRKEGALCEEAHAAPLLNACPCYDI